MKYRVDGREKDGRTYDTKAIAQRRLIELESAVHRGQWVDPTVQTTVAEYARSWAAARLFRPGTARRVDEQIRNHLEARPLGSRRLAAVRPSEVQARVAEMSQTLAPATVRLHVTMLKTVYAAAVLDRLVAASPVVRISLPRAEQPRVVPLTIAQVRALAAAVPSRHRAMVLAQAGLGLRPGELLALRQQDVNFRSVRVEHQLDDETRERVEPKTPRSRRTIPLPTMVQEALAAHVAQFPPLRAGTLFYGHNELPYAHAHYGTRVFKAAVRKLATAVAERLGHDNAGMAIKVYGHLLPDSEDRTRRAVDDAWNAPETAPTGAPAAQGRPR